MNAIYYLIMNKFVMLLASCLVMASCHQAAEIPYVEMKNYFFRNDALIPEDIRIDSQEKFDSMFGAAAFMGMGGVPTPVDFSREIVLAVVGQVTDVATELEPVSLVKKGGNLVLTCKETTGDKQSWSMQPLLLIKVDRSYDSGAARLEKLHESLPAVNHSEYKSNNPENMQQVRDFLHKTGFYFIATVDGDQPQVRPFGTAEIIEGKLYIQTGHVKAVAHQIAANPKVAICAYDGEKWLRITATLVEDPRVEIKKAMLDANPGLRSMYDENDSNTAVYYLTNAHATLSSFTAAPLEINF